MPSWLMIFPGSPGLSALLLVTMVVVVMYGARTPAHRGILGIARAIKGASKLTSEAIRRVQDRMTARTREVLLSSGLEDAERQIEQEFQRISATVDRDLGAYPALHRKLADQVSRIDEDYRRATDSPPAPAAWSDTLRAAGELAERAGTQPAAAKAVNALSTAIAEAHDEAMEAYREESRERHDLMAKMVPAWRSMASTLTRVEKSVGGIFERSRHLDDLMHRYQEIAAKSDVAERKLTSSTFTQFVISGVVLVIALLGGFINFQLIALPMSEMVGATSRLGTMQTSDVAALVIILIEITMGLFLMESLRITRLFPVIGRLDARTRRRMAYATFALLFVLAGIESSLAYMRDVLAADRVALTQALAGSAVQRPEFMWIPAVGQMVMGFILPFALTFVAIPLESFIHSSRIVVGQIAAGGLRMLAFGVELIGFSADHVGKGLNNLYDVIIFMPLKIEELVFEARSRARAGSQKAPSDRSASTAPTA
ncbi:MAG: hypothetical protein OEO79_17000 [Gemmatimonadota bacterium]|nr:hypothetical protein [Gemmatimonadota bacterium]MDH3424513.1 hypothetical protein [Gemmatimonadota bacterium]